MKYIKGQVVKLKSNTDYPEGHFKVTKNYQVVEDSTGNGAFLLSDKGNHLWVAEELLEIPLEFQVQNIIPGCTYTIEFSNHHYIVKVTQVKHEHIYASSCVAAGNLKDWTYYNYNHYGPEGTDFIDTNSMLLKSLRLSTPEEVSILNNHINYSDNRHVAILPDYEIC